MFRLKNTLAIIATVAGILLILAALARIKDIFMLIPGFIALVTGKMDAETGGYFTGHLIYWVFHFVAIYYLLKYARRGGEARKNSRL